MKWKYELEWIDKDDRAQSKEITGSIEGAFAVARNKIRVGAWKIAMVSVSKADD